MAPPLLDLRKYALTGNIQEHLDIFGLWVFVIAPLFALLGEQSDFFEANRVEPIVIVLFALIVTFIPPLLLILIRESLGFLPQKGKQAASLMIRAGLLALLIANFLHNLDVSIWLWLTLWIGVTSILTLVYNKLLSPILRACSITIVALPIIFLFASHVTPLLTPKATSYDSPVKHIGAKISSPPVIMIIFDELPLTSLLDEHGHINAQKYPGFAELEKTSNFYRGVHSVADNTLKAIPAIITGMYPVEGNAKREFEHNLFTMLADSYSLHIEEKVTNLCPVSLCPKKSSRIQSLQKLLKDALFIYTHLIDPPEIRAFLPNVKENWGDFGGEFNQIMFWKSSAQSRESTATKQMLKLNTWIEQIKPAEPGQKPPFYFIHILLPHAPYVFMPHGKYYATESSGPIFPYEWGGNQQEILQHYQRHLLQLQAVDETLQRLINHLKSTGLYDQSMLVIAADHGLSSQSHMSRRHATPENTKEILPVPLLIKMPSQKSPVVIDKPMRTIDIMPTMADLLNIQLKSPSDGQSIHSRNFPVIKQVPVYLFSYGNKHSAFPVLSVSEVSRSFSEKEQLNRYHDALGLYRIGPHPEWIGQSIKQLPIHIVDNGVQRFYLEHPEEYQTFNPKGPFIPALIEGKLDTAKSQLDSLGLMVSINGRIWSTYPVLKKSGQTLKFYALVPETAFQPGINNVEILLPNSNPQTWQIIRAIK